MNRKQRRAAAKTGNRPANYAMGATSDGWRTRNRALFNDALQYHRVGRFQEAHRLCQDILARDPDDIDALHLAGLMACQVGLDEVGIAFFRRALALNDTIPAIHHNIAEAYRGTNRLDEAADHYRRAIGLHPQFAEAHANLGTTCLQQGRLDAAVAALRKAVTLTPQNAVAHNNLGTALERLGKAEEASAAFDAAVAADPDYVEAHYNAGNALLNLKRPEQAVACYDRALALNPDHAEAQHNRGNALAELGRFDDAVGSYDRALALKPFDTETLCSRGNALFELKRYEEALAAFDRAMLTRPDLAEARKGRGNALYELQRHEEALAAFERAVALKPDDPEAWSGLGSTLFTLKRPDEALIAFDRSLALRPDFVLALSNRGVTLYAHGRYDEAIESYDKALAAEPGSFEILRLRGTAQRELGRHDEAVNDFERLLKERPDHPYALGELVYSRLFCCDWRDYDENIGRLAGAVAAGRPASTPFSFLTAVDSPEAQRRCTQIYAQDRHKAAATGIWTGERYRHDRIRVAYLSADFHNHATVHLMAGLFEAHDRARFETTAISFGPRVSDAGRTRVEPAFDRFIDVTRRTDRDVAGLLRELEIDIAVDLKGYTRGYRPDILALRPSPIQVNYLGYPGTMAAENIDYIIADRFVIPEHQQHFYSENVVYLPDSYQVNDSRRRIAETVPTRAEAGLPESGFVFCSFNNNFKITPAVFDVWMRLLNEVEGSVIWLLQDSAAAAANLRREAENRGVAAERLVFAPRLDPDEHLARHRLADLFLDTLPVNAHTTASDALWVGLPVVTCPGATFAARVAGSLLHAVGLPELIAGTLDEYAALALKLARDPALLAATRAKLARHRDTFPLFDTDRYRRHIESAYHTMWERCQRGEPAAGFAVTAAA